MADERDRKTNNRGELMPSKRAKKPRARPRVPLPRQTGGVHAVKVKELWRRRKHKKKDEQSDQGE